MIALLVRLRAVPGKAEMVEAHLRTMAQLVQEREQRCEAYFVHRSVPEPDVFVIYERYVDEAALDEHRTTAHFRELIEGAVIPLLIERSREDLVVTTTPSALEPTSTS